MNKIEFIGTKESLYVHHLDNGLDIYMVPKNNVKNFYITLNVKYGSIYTNYKVGNNIFNDPKGIAHYLEHLMFNMPDGDAFDVFSKLGSSANAYTSNDVTCYEVFSNSKFKENLEHLIHFVYTPYFTKELINKERGIISEEIKMYEDDPSTEVFHGLFENIFIKDERRYLVAGKVNDIKDIKLDNIENAYRAFYHPQNMFMVITGNFNPEEAVAIITESMNKIGFPELEIPELITPKEPFDINNAYNEKEMNVLKPKVVIGYKIPKNNFKALKLSNLELKLYLNLIIRINFGATSLLNEEMKSNGIINRGIGNRLIDTDDYYIESFITETDYPDYFITRIKETFENLKITEEDVNRKIKSSISNLIYLFDNIEAVNSEIQDDIINYGNVITDAYKLYKTLDADTASEVIEKLGKNLQVVNIIKPKNEESV